MDSKSSGNRHSRIFANGCSLKLLAGIKQENNRDTGTGQMSFCLLLGLQQRESQVRKYNSELCTQKSTQYSGGNYRQLLYLVL